MWDGHLGTIKETEHRIELAENAKPSLQPPYHAEPMQRKLEEEEIAKMLKLEVIEPVTSE